MQFPLRLAFWAALTVPALLGPGLLSPARAETSALPSTEPSAAAETAGSPVNPEPSVDVKPKEAPANKAPSKPVENPFITQAKLGKIGCVTPDPKAKTCYLMISLAWQPNGQIQYEMVSQIGSSSPIYERGPISFEDDKLCFLSSSNLLSTASLRRPAAREMPARLILVSDASQPEATQLCLQFSPLDEIFAVRLWQNGHRVPKVFARWRWVSKSDGFKPAEKMGFH